MPKIFRVHQKQFGSAGPNGDFGQFGSLKAGSKTFTKDPEVIQALSAFLNGWGSAVVGGYRPALEDMNGLFLLAFRQVAYMLQEGIPEWDTATIYYTGSMVKYSGILYVSLAEDNTGKIPSSNPLYWKRGIGGENGGVPTGTILNFSGPLTTVPAGYLYCDGTAINRTVYSDLFDIIGERYGAGNGTTTFNLPDSRGKVLVGLDGTTEFGSIGQTGGAKTHTLTEAEIPPVTPKVNGGNAAYGLQKNGLGALEGSYANSYTIQPFDAVGGGGAHPNLQPYLVIGGSIIRI